MLSAVVAPLIEKALGKWIKLEPGKLDVSGGKVRLTKVEIREDAWDKLGLPVALRGGMIEEVEVDIPWTKLKTDSVVVRLHQPVLLLSPHSESEWDSALEAKRSQTRKEHELQKLREVAAPVSADAAYAPIDDAGGQNFLDKLIARAIENAQVLVTSAVIRYEDYTHAATPFGIEVAFDSLWVHPEHIHAPEPGGGGSGGQAQGDTRPPLAHREALVCALCAYMLDSSSLPPRPQVRPCGSPAVLEERMTSAGLPLNAPAALRANARRCCLWPLSFAMELASRRVDQPSLPQHVWCMETGRLHIELSAHELHNLAACSAYFARFGDIDIHRSFRPPLSQRPRNGFSRAWWRFAIDAVRWQVQLRRAPYTWPAVMRRGMQRRAFVHLHKMLLQKGGVEKLSEGERVSLTQLRDALSAADQHLYERLASAQVEGNGVVPSHAWPLRPPTKRRSLGAEMERAEMKMKLSSSQRKALASMLSSDHDKRMLNERLSIHARLLLSEAIITLHTGGGPSSTATIGPTPDAPTIQMTISNAGAHLGLEPWGILSDVYCQSIRIDALVGGRGVPSVPLVGPVPSSSAYSGGRSRAQHIPVEVDTTAAFSAAGLDSRLPALCARSDVAHKSSMWQVGVRWLHEQRAAPSSRGDTLCGAAQPAKQKSELAVRWRSSEQLAILLNHQAVSATTTLAASVGACFSRVDPAANLRPPREVQHMQTLRERFESGGSEEDINEVVATRGRSHSINSARAAQASEEAFRQSLGVLEGVTVRLSVDLAAPVWLWLLRPDKAASQALALSVRRLLIDGLIAPSSVNDNGVPRASALPSRIDSDVPPPRSPARTPKSPRSQRADSNESLQRTDSLPLAERAKRASWGVVRGLGALGKSTKKFGGSMASFGVPMSSSGISKVNAPKPSPSSQPIATTYASASPSGPPGARLRLEVQHIQLKITTLNEWSLEDAASAPAHSTAAGFGVPLAPFDIAVDAKVPLIENGATQLDVTLTPLVVELHPPVIVALKELFASNSTAPSPPASRPSSPPVPLQAAVLDPRTDFPASVRMVLRRSRFRVDIAALNVALRDDALNSDRPLLELRLMCIGLSATGGERLRIDAIRSDSPFAAAKQTEALLVPSGGVQLAATVALMQITGVGTPHLQVLPSPLDALHEADGTTDHEAVAPGPDGLTVRLSMPPDLVTGAPSFDPSRPPIIQLGQLLLEVQPDAIAQLATRVHLAAAESGLIPLVASPARTPSAPPSPDRSACALAQKSVDSMSAVDTIAERDTMGRTLKATSLVIHQAIAILVDDTPAQEGVERPPPAQVELRSHRVGLAFPPDQVSMLLGSLELCVGLVAQAPELQTLVRTHGPLRTTFSPGFAWTCELDLPMISMREPLSPPESFHALSAALGEMKANVLPPQAVPAAVMDAAVLTDAVDLEMTPSVLVDANANAEGPASVSVDAPEKASLPELDVRMTLWRTSLIDVSSSTGKASSGLELRLGAMQLHLGLRPDPEWRSQLDLSNEDDALQTESIDSARASLSELAATLASSSGPAGSTEYEIASLPAAAFHATIEMRPDGAQPTCIELAFGDDAARVCLEPSRLERLQLFGARLGSLKLNEEGENPTKIAVSLPRFQLELTCEKSADAALAVLATPSKGDKGASQLQSTPPGLIAAADGLVAVIISPPIGRLAGAPAQYNGPMDVGVRVEALHIGLHGVDTDGASTSPPPLLSSSAGALDVRLLLPADWTAPAAADVNAAPLCVAISPEIVAAVSAHAAEWTKPAAPTQDTSVAPPSATPVSADALIVTSATANGTTNAASSLAQPINLRMTMCPSEIWLLLAPLDTLPDKTTGTHAHSERLGLRVGLGAQVSMVHSVAEEVNGDTPEKADAATPAESRRRVTYDLNFEHHGSMMGVFSRSPSVIDATAVDATTIDAKNGNVVAAGQSELVVSPVDIRATAKVTDNGEGGNGLRTAEASFVISNEIAIAISTPQLKLLADFAECLSPEGQPTVGKKKRRKKRGHKADTQAATSATVVEGEKVEEDKAASAILTAWLRTNRLSHFNFNALLVGGAHATLYGAVGTAGQPLARVCMPHAMGEVHLMAAGPLTQNAISLQLGLEMMLWSRAALAWEVLLARTGATAQAQQVRGGIWSGCLEVEPIAFTASEWKVQRLFEANQSLALAMAAPVTIDAVRPKPQQPVVQISNQSGCVVRARVRGVPEAVLLTSGERRVVELPTAPDVASVGAPAAAPEGSTPTSTGATAAAGIDDLMIEAGGVWHVLPPLPAGRFGTWTFLAHAKQPDSTRPNSGTNGGGAKPPAASLSEPVAVQCVVRPLADEAGAVGGAGLSVVVRSIAVVHNATDTAVAVQLLVPSNLSSGAVDLTDDASTSGAQHHPTLTHATASAMDLGADKLLDLGVVPAGGTLPIPPQLSNVAYLRTRPATDGFQWPDASAAFWLGSCNTTRRQARHLARIQTLFALPATEQLIASWACSLVGTDGGRVRGRLYLASSCLAFHGSRDTKRLLHLEQLTSLEKTSADRALGVRSSAAITARTADVASRLGGEQPMQLCGFTSRNRVYAAMQKELAARMPHLAATWRTPSSAKLQTHLEQPPDVLCLGELRVSVVSGDGAQAGVLLVTPHGLGFVADAGESKWHVEIGDVLSLRAEAIEAVSTARRTPLKRSKTQQASQFHLHARAFESVLDLHGGLADAVELLEGVLPEDVLDTSEVSSGDRAASTAARQEEGDEMLDVLDADDASSGAIVHQLTASSANRSLAFHLCLSVQSRQLSLHGHSSGRGAPSIQQTTVTLSAPLQLENTLPYTVGVLLSPADTASDGLPPSAQMQPGCSVAVAMLPGAASLLKLRLRIAGDAWGSPLAEYARSGSAGTDGWRSGLALQCTLRDPHGRPAHVTIQKISSGSSRSVLALQVEAPLWVLNYSQLPLVYSASTPRFGAARLAARQKQLTKKASSLRTVHGHGDGGGGAGASGAEGARAKAAEKAKAVAEKGKAVGSALQRRALALAETAKAQAELAKGSARAKANNLKQHTTGGQSAMVFEQEEASATPTSVAASAASQARGKISALRGKIGSKISATAAGKMSATAAGKITGKLPFGGKKTQPPPPPPTDDEISAGTFPPPPPPPPPPPSASAAAEDDDFEFGAPTNEDVTLGIVEDDEAVALAEAAEAGGDEGDEMDGGELAAADEEGDEEDDNDDEEAEQVGEAEDCSEEEDGTFAGEDETVDGEGDHVAMDLPEGVASKGDEGDGSEEESSEDDDSADEVEEATDEGPAGGSAGGSSTAATVVPPKKVPAGPLLLGGRRVKLGLGGGAKGSGKWAKAVLCEVVGDAFGVPLGTFEVGLNVLAPPAASPRSRVLVLHPRMRILNRSGLDLQYQSRGGRIGGILSAQNASSVPFHWGETPLPERFLQLAPLDAAQEEEWCGAFSIDVPTELVVSLAPDARHPDRPRLLQVAVEAVGPALLISLDLTESAPYNIRNDFAHGNLLVRQKGTGDVRGGVTHIIPSQSSLGYTWDEPTGSRTLLVRLVDDSPPSINVEQQQRLSESDFAPAAVASYREAVEFEIRPEELVAPTPHRPPGVLQPSMWTSVRLGVSTRLVHVSPSPPLDDAGTAELHASMLVSVASLSLSLEQLVHIKVDGLSLSAMSSALEHEVQFTVQLIHVACQLPRALTPVILVGEALEEGEPWLRANACRRRTEKRIKNLALNTQQLVIALDEPLLVAVHAFSQRCTPPTPQPITGTAAATTLAEPLALVRKASAELKAPPNRRRRPWYIDELHLEKLSLQLSYRSGGGGGVRPASGGASGWKPPPLPSVSGLQLELRPFGLQQRFFERRRLLKMLRKHYGGEARRQVHKILLHTNVAATAGGIAHVAASKVKRK